MDPELHDVHVDRVLTNLSIGYQNLDYIGTQIFPVIRTPNQSGLIPKYDKSHWFRNLARQRRAGTASQRGGFTIDRERFYTPRYSFGYELDDETRDNTDNPFDLDRDGANLVADKIEMAKEVIVAENFFREGVWSEDLDGESDFTQWDDYGSAAPLQEMTDHLDAVETQIGREPNTMVIGKQVWNKLKWHPTIIDLIKYTTSDLITEDVFANMAGVGRLLIGRSLIVDDDDYPGRPEEDVRLRRIWGKHALLLYVPGAPSYMNPAAGYTFVWNRVPNADMYVRRFRDEEREVTVIEGNAYFAPHQTAAEAGMFLKNVVS